MNVPLIRSRPKIGASRWSNCHENGDAWLAQHTATGSGRGKQWSGTHGYSPAARIEGKPPNRAIMIRRSRPVIPLYIVSHFLANRPTKAIRRHAKAGIAGLWRALHSQQSDAGLKANVFNADWITRPARSCHAVTVHKLTSGRIVAGLCCRHYQVSCRDHCAFTHTDRSAFWRRYLQKSHTAQAGPEDRSRSVNARVATAVDHE